jgi:hypothetical protein
VAGAIAVTGCGSDDNSSSKAPAQENVSASGGTTTAAAGVSAKGRATPSSLCASEGKGKPKKQCTAGLTKLDRGKVSNPKAACKGLSKKKTKGVRGKSPYAVCIKAAAKLMAAKTARGGGGNGAADSGSPDDSSGDSSSADSSADDAEPICRDANGNTVPFDSEDVEECDLPPGADDSASSSSDDSSSDDSSSDDPSADE